MGISLDGRTAIVTGAGAGLGRAYANDLARHGAAVVVNDIVHERADAVVAEIASAGGRAAAAYDSVADPRGARAIVATAVDTFGALDVVVNNAGIMRNAYFEDLTPEDVELVLATNVKGCFFVTQAAWGVMRERGYGRVVMVGSAAGTWGMQAVSNYAAAKGGVHGLARALAFEGRDHGILVNTLLPGAATGITAATPVPDRGRHVPAELGAALAARRTVASVAPMATYLASEACTVTGETFSSVAGRHARVTVGLTEGWFADEQDRVTADDIAAHLDEISALDTLHHPRDLYDEYRGLGPRLGVAPGAA